MVKSITVVALSIIILGLVGLISSQSGLLKQQLKDDAQPVVRVEEPKPQPVAVATTTAPQVELKPLNVPEGWKPYYNKDWNVAFAIPKGWVTQEFRIAEGDSRPIPVGSLVVMDVNGDGYSIAINNRPGGLSEETLYTHPEYTVSGYKPTTFLETFGAGFKLYVVMHPVCHGIWFGIRNASTTDRKIADEFLSTVHCE